MDKRKRTGLALLAPFLLVLGCGGDDFSGGGSPGGGGFGATPGGVKDMGLARALIAEGRVPPPEAFLVEGMFSEHDLGLAGPVCPRTLCLRAALGIAPTRAGEPSAWLQVGLSSTIEPATFVRPSVTFVATVDVSGSMGWGYADNPSPGEVSRRLLAAIARELGPDDRIAIVTYGSDVDVPLALVSGDQQSDIQAAIEALHENGSTNMEAGLAVAYDVARAARGQTDEVRLLLFTDVQPNVGAATASEFEAMAATGADDGIGITVFAMGLGLGQEILAGISHLDGGNAFSLFDFDDVETLVAEEWPWFASPIAYDLRLSLSPTPGFTVGEAYGFPARASGELPGLEVATVFLSRRKGALLRRLAAPAGFDGLRVDGTLTYRTPAGEVVDAAVSTAYVGQALDARGQYFQQASTAKTVALALLVSGMREAAERYEADPTGAADLMAATDERFAADAAALADPGLAAEVALSAELLRLMRAGAPQGAFYPQ